MKRLFLMLIAVLTTVLLSARQTYPVNSGWRFYSGSESDTVRVSLPHCYSASFVGTGNYVRHINISSAWASKRLFLRFGGAGTVATLFVNGKLIGEHIGGNAAFGFEITNAVNYGVRNLVQVIVSNTPRTDVLPTASTGVQWGGLYGGVELVVADGAFIEGVLVRPTKVTNESVTGNVVVKVSISTARSETFEIRAVAPDGETVVSESKKVNVARGISDIQIPFTIDNPHLWDGTNRANMYAVSVSVGGDKVELQTGFRYFAVSNDNGFQLNGKPYSLKGVVLWRDGIAVRDDIVRDLNIITEMGANAIRVAEGAYSDEFYRLCDKLGIVVMSDLPFIGEPTLLGHGYYPTSAFKANAFAQYYEQITQHFNNPSIIFWGVFVNPTLKGDYPVQFITELNKFIKTTDNKRLTVGVSNNDGEINTIPDLIVFDHFLGWREGTPSDIAVWHTQLFRSSQWKQLRSAVSYRAGGETATQSSAHKRPDPSSSYHPEGWQTYFHRTYMQTLSSDRRFWAMWVGDMFDYTSQTAPSGSVTGMTDYGVVSADRRTRKDSYYLYKAVWGTEKFAYIVGRRNSQRVDSMQNIIVFSSCDSVRLTVNGTDISTLHNTGNGVFVWEKVVLSDGENSIAATGDADRTDEVKLVIVKELI